MRAARALVAAAAFAIAAAATASTNAARPHPVVSLTASPARLALVNGDRSAITLTNRGSARAVVRLRPSAVAVDLRGRPSLARRAVTARDAARWLSIRPRRLLVPAGASEVVSVTVRVPRGAQPGDHHAAVVVSTLPIARGLVGVRMRLAVRVSVRAPGVVRRDLAIRSLRVRRSGGTRRLELRLSNRGNVTEELARRVRIALATTPRAIIGFRGRRELLPRRDGILAARLPRTRRGIVSARVSVRGAGARTFRIRL